MSMPFSIIACNRCEESWASSRLWGLFRYELGDGVTAFIERTLGWCDGCCEMQPIEEMPAKSDLEAALLKAQQELDGHSATMTDHERQGALLTRWQRFVENVLCPSQRKKQLERVEQYQRLQKNVVTATAHLNWLETRISPPRCLICSSTEVKPIDYTFDRHQPYDLALAHPHCGGLLTVHKSAVQIASGRRKLYYDPEGNRLTPIEQVVIPPRSDKDEYFEF